MTPSLSSVLSVYGTEGIETSPRYTPRENICICNEKVSQRRAIEVYKEAEPKSCDEPVRLFDCSIYSELLRYKEAEAKRKACVREKVEQRF
jgi:hypothetical protein